VTGFAPQPTFDRLEGFPRSSTKPTLSLAIAGRRPDVSVTALITRHVGLLDDAEEGASRVLKHNKPLSLPLVDKSVLQKSAVR
jgi:hypothetical protein